MRTSSPVTPHTAFEIVSSYQRRRLDDALASTSCPAICKRTPPTRSGSVPRDDAARSSVLRVVVGGVGGSGGGGVGVVGVVVV